MNKYYDIVLDGSGGQPMNKNNQVEKAAEEYAENKCQNIQDETVRKLSIMLTKNDFIAGANWKTGEGWISVEDGLPEGGQKVDLWLVPSNGVAQHRIHWTWEQQDAKSIIIGNAKVTHWRAAPSPPIDLK